LISEKDFMAFRPLFLTQYKALSAQEITPSEVDPSSGKQLMPMLTVTLNISLLLRKA